MISFPAFLGIRSLLGALLVQVLPVIVNTNEGERLEGNLLGIQNSAVQIELRSGERSLPFESLSVLESQTGSVNRGPASVVQLVGGSRVGVDSVSGDGETVTLQLRGQPELQVPANQVRAIRFRRGSEQTDTQWLGWLEEEQRADMLVIRREGNRLDPQQGVVTGMQPETVGFDLEGTLLDAPIERLEGVIFASSNALAEPASISVMDSQGSEWRVQSIATDADSKHLNLAISEGILHQIALDQVASIRWSSGMVLLASSESVNSEFQTTFGSEFNPKLLNAFFAASSDDSDDLTMHGGASIEYRVDRGFTKFVGAIQRHPDAEEIGNAKVRIELDGVEKWSEVIAEGQVKGFEIPLGEARRLVIRVDRQDDGEVGDTVRVTRPRLLK